jgi:hypothetical protein
MKHDDSFIVEYLARHPHGDDQFSDAAQYPYEFLKGYRDVEESRPETTEPTWSMAQGSAYRLGRYEKEQEL